MAQGKGPFDHQIPKTIPGRKTMSKERLIVIGGDAAGMSAASQARRRKQELEIIAFERGAHTSYSA